MDNKDDPFGDSLSILFREQEENEKRAKMGGPRIENAPEHLRPVLLDMAKFVGKLLIEREKLTKRLTDIDQSLAQLRQEYDQKVDAEIKKLEEVKISGRVQAALSEGGDSSLWFYTLAGAKNLDPKPPKKL